MKKLLLLILILFQVAAYAHTNPDPDSSFIKLLDRFRIQLETNRHSENKDYILFENMNDAVTLQLERQDLDKAKINSNFENSLQVVRQQLTQFNSINQFNSEVYLYIHLGNIVKQSMQYDAYKIKKLLNIIIEIPTYNNERKDNKFDLQKSIDRLNRVMDSLVNLGQRNNPKKVLIIAVDLNFISTVNDAQDKIEELFAIHAGFKTLDDQGNPISINPALNEEVVADINDFQHSDINNIVSEYLKNYDGITRITVLGASNVGDYSEIEKNSIVGCRNFFVDNSIKKFSEAEFAKITFLGFDSKNGRLQYVRSNDFEGQKYVFSKQELNYDGKRKVVTKYSLICFDAIDTGKTGLGGDVVKVENLVIDGVQYVKYIGLNSKFIIANLVSEVECQDGIQVVYKDKDEFAIVQFDQKTCEQVKNQDSNFNKEYSGNYLINYTDMPIDKDALDSLLSGLKQVPDAYSGERRTLLMYLVITDSADDFEKAEKLIAPSGYNKIWIHRENNKYIIKNVEFTKFPGLEEYAAKIGKSAQSVLNDYMAVNVQSLDYAATGLYLLLDKMSRALDGLKLDPKIWDCDNPDEYNKFYADLLGYLLKPLEDANQILLKGLDLDNSEVRQLVNITLAETHFAALCGIWDGMVDLLVSVPNVLKIVPQVLSSQGRDTLIQQWNGLKSYKQLDANGNVTHSGAFYAIYDGLQDHFDPGKPCQFAHNVTSFLLPIAICFVPGGQGASSSIAGKVLQFFKKVINLTDKFDVVSIVGSKAFYLITKTGKKLVRALDGKMEFITKKNGKYRQHYVDEDAFDSKYNKENETYEGEQLQDLDDPNVRLFDNVNRLLTRLNQSTDKFFDPVVLSVYDDFLLSFKGQYPDIGSYTEMLDVLETSFPELRTELMKHNISERYFKFKVTNPLELQLTENQWQSLQSEFTDKKYELEVIFLNIEPDNATALFDDLRSGSQEFSGLLLVDGKKVRAWEKFVEDGLSPEFRQNIVNLNQRFILNEWAGSIATGTNKQKGNFGEIGADLDLNAKGYKSLQSRINDIESSGHNGIDIVVEKDGVYYIIEGKYIGSAKLNPANPRTGLPKQMTDDWIAQGNYQRLVEAVGQDLANRIIDKGYRRILAKTSKNGSVIYKELDLNAEIIGDWLP